MTIDFDKVVHPNYARMEARWRKAYDYWRGGIHVLSPDWMPTIARTAIPVTSRDDSDEDPDLPRQLSKYITTTDYRNSYLFKHDRESNGNYESRTARTIHLPIFQAVINVFAAGILRTAPNITGRGIKTEPWKTWTEDVDLCGTNIDAFVRQALALALTFGRVHAITDRPSARQPAKSRGEQVRRKERAYTYLLTPLDLVDWELDEFGSFVWARIKEPSQEPRLPTEEIVEERFQHRIWYRDRWELWRMKPESGKSKTEKEWGIVAKGKHPAGEVPISTLFATKDSRPATMTCESPLADVCDIDMDILNRLSELDEFERMQTFAILFIPTLEGGPTGAIEVGPHSAITGPSEAGPPSYISPDQEIAAGKWRRIQEKTYEVRQLTGAGRGRAEYSKEERSAAAIGAEGEDKQNQMAWLAASTEKFHNKTMSHVASYEKAKTQPIANYPRNFDLKGVSSQVNDLIQLNSTQVLGKKAKAELAKPLVERMMKEHGADEDKIEEVKAAIDEESLKEDPIPTMPGAGGFPSKRPPGNDGNDNKSNPKKKEGPKKKNGT